MSHSEVVPAPKREEKKKNNHIVSLKIGSMSATALLLTLIHDIICTIWYESEPIKNYSALIIGVAGTVIFCVILKSSIIIKLFPYNLNEGDKVIESTVASASAGFIIEKMVLPFIDKSNGIVDIVFIIVILIMMIVFPFIINHALKKKKRWLYSEY